MPRSKNGAGTKTNRNFRISDGVFSEWEKYRALAPGYLTVDDFIAVLIQTYYKTYKDDLLGGFREYLTNQHK